MLGDIIYESDIFEILHPQDSQTIAKAKSILREAPVHGFISGDNIDRIWFDKNIRSQEELLHLKTRVDAISNQFQVDFLHLEGQCLKSGEYEFIKARDERIATMMANEEVLKDKKESINELKGISSYIDGLLWSLRDLIKLFKN